MKSYKSVGKQILTGFTSVSILVAFGAGAAFAQDAQPVPAKVGTQVKGGGAGSGSDDELRGLSTWDSCHAEYYISGVGVTPDVNLGDVSKSLNPPRTKRQNCLIKAKC